MISKLISTPILIIFTLLPFISTAYSDDTYAYYPMTVRYKNIAKDCEKYVSSNLDSTKVSLVKLDTMYSKNDWPSIREIIENNNLNDFDENLFNCSAAFEFDGGVNYFDEAHGYIMLILHIINNNDAYLVDVDISEYVTNAINSLNMLSKSYRKTN